MAWSKETRIITMLAIDIVFFAVELTSGFMLHSLALMADAFHMLNDIISLFIGLWAVRAAQKASDDKYSYGYLRAEILGAFFNAVFLIALCVSIVLEALGRLIEPSEISNPQVMLIVGSFGLASNLVGFLVLGGHGHSHGPGNGHDHDHDHDHDHEHEIASGEAHYHENPHNSSHDHAHDHAHDHSHSHSNAIRSAEEGIAGYGATSRSHIHNHKRLTSIEDLSIHPASFRHDILTVSRKIEEPLETSSTDSDNDATATESQPTESTSLLRPSVAVFTDISSHKHAHTHTRSRRDSEIIHSEHNHNKPRSATSSHSHGHNHDDMGMNAMVLHVLGDALGNVGVIATALVVWLTEWRYKLFADPLVSLFITAIILYSALPLTYATSKVLLQATPDHLNVNEIREDIEALPGVVSCHHIHIWQLSDTKVVASMHMQVAFPMSEAGGEKYMELARRARKCLHAYGIHSATIQPEYCLDPEHAADHEQLAHEIHAQGGSGNYDGLGLSSPPQRGDLCLLECVDNCVGKGCCPSPSAQQSPVLSRSSSLSGQSQGRGHSGHQH